MAEDPDKQCKFIKNNGEQCNKNAQVNDDYCWVHKGGKVNEEALKKLKPKMGSANPNFKHGLHSNVLKLMCNDRCYMYDECEVRTDTDEGKEMFGGICFFEVDSDMEEDQLLQMEGLKIFIINILKKLEARINRGLRYELATGGFLSEPEVGAMFRTVSNLAFNLSGIYEQEEMNDLREQLEAVRELYKEAIKGLD